MGGHFRQGTPTPVPSTCLGAPAPSKVLLPPRAPESTPRTSPRTSAAADPAAPSARAQPRVWLRVGRAPRASRPSRPRDLVLAVGAPPESTNLGGGQRGESEGTPATPPPPAARSPFMPGPRCSAAPDTCRSHRRPGLPELLISPGAARRRLGRSGRWSFRGLGQETPAAVAAEDTPKRNAAHSPAPARSRRPDLSRREVSGFSRKRTRAHRRTARSSQRGHSPPGRCRPRAPGDPGWAVGGDLRGPGGHSSPRVRRSGLQRACHIRASLPPPQAPGTVPGTWPPTERGEG